MNDTIEMLLELQDVDVRIFNLQRQILSVPEEKERIRVELQQSEDELTAAKEGVMHIETEAKRIELDIATANDQITKFRQRSAEVKKNEEYRAVMAEIKTQQELIAQYEERQLEAWERLEAAKKKFEDVQRTHAIGQARIEAALEDLDVRERNCAAQSDKVSERRAEAAAKVDRELLRLYDRIISRSKGSKHFIRGVVPMNHESCGGCFLKITPQVVNKVKKNELVTCENCGVFLYYNV